jgi:hypothetical protein
MGIPLFSLSEEDFPEGLIIAGALFCRRAIVLSRDCIA